VSTPLPTPVRPPADTVHRLLPAPGAPARRTLAEHLAAFGPDAERTDALAADLERAGLRGRGGAWFPTHRKLAAVAAARGRPVVVANGAEGEPVGAKDSTLLTTAPHLVLDGLQHAAAAVAADRCYVYVQRVPDVVDAVRAALAERREARVDRVGVELVDAPVRYLAGEESAAVSLISGGPARPRFRPPPVYQRGVRGRPTLVLNVETLAHTALVARYGPEWYRGVGTPDEPGTALFSVGGAVHEPGVVEAALGTPLRDLLARAGGASGTLSAVLVGGYHGTWLPADRLGVRLSGAGLREHGARLGTGVVVALPEHACGLAETARVVGYLAEQSAHQCGPCRNGLPLIADAFTRLATPGERAGSALRADVERWMTLVRGRGACHHPDGTVNLVASALAVFGGELQRHERGRCQASSARPVLPVPDESPDGWR
jgi:NADH:ubiquinone oxidoreductase subunit F (NADH-binding)